MIIPVVIRVVGTILFLYIAIYVVLVGLALILLN